MLAKEYGPVFTVYLGMKPTVVLHGYETLKEALVDRGDEFSGKTQSSLLSRVKEGLGAPCDPSFLLACVPCNVISAVIFQHRFDYNDEIFQKVTESFHRIIKALESPWAQLSRSFGESYPL
ncbi:Cytochrome P450 2C70 [Cricetulus griseus]|uniref:Cytochrome P450 2C70 n=1 Tax=Cricetulus griseus TaxID=10029 RepID=G3HXY2_CRIGR|nr:Cytochrome P450 2C70 [Cricetulus griseus]